ncbi:hypothetical protein AB205_0069320, partial [Aquarana catesbeiana]
MCLRSPSLPSLDRGSSGSHWFLLLSIPGIEERNITSCTKEMVMEKPSPLLVGREFVRQYYTLLNKAPDFLHRNSSYVHGGLDVSGKPQEAVYGQAEIHKKVMSLQFSECRTKIRHVDAHATLSDGVVVQVMGELSNNGQPMRKFMQTFVLAPEV